ncbi:FecR family protein [Mangrovibacterium lignilyticum]|uniref:FecR family protein n=1 Tax=Mangrovibacterium lignilyticum TaxID=2668052 RepID=UPI0013D129B1|nr:FecR domain-containing protein [Mangrovibacterium lignilyticum]
MTIERNRIERLFAQKGSLADYKKLDEYFADEHLNKQVKEAIREQWENFDPDSDSDLAPVDNFHKQYFLLEQNGETTGGKHRLLFQFRQIAAILVAGLIIAGAIYFTRSKTAGIPAQEIQFYSHDGFRSQFTLPDGTTGWLGYNSVLKYHVDNDAVRTVELDGLAYFDVHHLDEKYPFQVTTPSKLNIEVLGTKFNVVSYSDENTCEVVLEQGSVSLNVHEKEVGQLKPNERMVFNIKENKLSKSIVNVHDFLAWKDGKLILHDLSLEETCVKLSRFYNTDIVLESEELKDKKVRLVLEDESLEEALALIALLFPVEYEVVERNMIDNNSFTKKKIILKLKKKMD